MTIKIKENSWIAGIAARKLKSEKVALTLGRTIHLYNTSRNVFLKDSKWLLHELKHVDQFRQYGFLSFLLLYLWESFRKGYRNNKFEIEARLAENEELKLENVKFI